MEAATDSNAQAAFEVLWNAHRTGRTIHALPQDLRPRTRSDAYAIQQQFGYRTSRVLGWKIAATSAAGQRHLRVERPMAGRLLAEGEIEPGGRSLLAQNSMKLAEVEFAFEMSESFAPRDAPYSFDDVLDGCGALYLALEIPSSRFKDPASVGSEQLIADNACAFQFSMAPAASQGWRTGSLGSHCVTAISSSGVTRRGTGKAVLGDPLIALTWLVNELSRFGMTLSSGQMVLTGTCIDPLPVLSGHKVTGDFGKFGRLDLSFV